MADPINYASGNWHVKEGSEDDFVARWREFLEWTQETAQGFQHAYLLRGKSDSRHFVSYSTWDDEASQRNWRSLPDFQQKLGACQDQCDDFSNDTYERVLTVG